VVGIDSGNLTGSAQAVLNALRITIPPHDQDLVEHIDKLYLTFIARNCTNSTIAAASAYCINLMGASLIPSNTPIQIAERSYILPGKTTGGNLEHMLYPIVVAALANFNPPSL